MGNKHYHSDNDMIWEFRSNVATYLFSTLQMIMLYPYVIRVKMLLSSMLSLTNFKAKMCFGAE